VEEYEVHAKERTEGNVGKRTRFNFDHSGPDTLTG
jgi:hypothetical protein